LLYNSWNKARVSDEFERGKVEFDVGDGSGKVLMGF
jgi:hypothetical protein